MIRGLYFRQISSILFTFASLVATCGLAFAQPEKTTSTAIQYSEEENSQAIQLAAQRWKLTEEEYHRYLEIMKGPLSRWSPSIDPVLALGLFSESDVERQRYAELYAEQEHNLTVRTLAFERAYRDAFAHLFPDAEIIDSRLLRPYYTHQQQKASPSAASTFFKESQSFKPGDRLLFFPDSHCRKCGAKVSRWLEKLTALSIVIDVYVRGTQSEEEVRGWAANNALDIQWVNNGKITLNIDGGLHKRLKQRTASTAIESLLFLSRDKRVFVLNEGVLE